jgi:ataxin-3
VSLTCFLTAQPQYWWREEDLLKGKTNAMTRADDPWKDVGSGRRLDGGKKSNGAGQQSKPISQMTEEEMLQMAMEASLEQAPQKNDTISYPLTEEPAVGVKIQFRMPDGTRAVRRFLESDFVGSIYSYVSSKSDDRNVELRAGFPPKDISSKKDQTIAEAKLAGEMIHGRYA